MICQGRLSIIGLISGLALAGVLAAGCVDGNPSFYISSVYAPGESCSAAGEAPVPKGLLDVSAKRGYLGFPLVHNSLDSSTSQQSGPERNNLRLEKVEIKLDLGSIPGNFEQYSKRTESVAATIAPGESIAVRLQILPDALAAALISVVPKDFRPTVIADLQVFASRTSSDDETEPFPFPIELCNGCLVDLRASCPDRDPDSEETILTNPCGAPQDTEVTCCPVAGRTTLKCFSDSEL